MNFKLFFKFLTKTTSLENETIALPKGCSELDSAVPITANKRFKESLSLGNVQKTLTTRGRPSVTVPVLSRTTVVTLNIN